MGISRRAFLLSGMAAACSRRGAGGPLRSAAQYLWSKQGGDGGFHSVTYGLLRSGQSLTPFVLDALLDVPERILPPPRDAVDRALEFIQARTNGDGMLGTMDPSAPDYPNYATALAVVVMIRSRARGLELQIGRMMDQLRSQQFGEDNGWTPDDPAYGGWGMGGAVRRPPDAGHVDLSMTRYVIEALRTGGVPASDPVMRRALAFVSRAQNADRGFYFSPVNPEINKAGENGEGFRSYGTATADGVLALRALDIAESDPRLAGAIAWLREHHRPDIAPGFEGARESWSQGLRFYYAHVATRALPDLDVRLPDPQNDGSFRNNNNLVKEDDPLIATAFATHVLAARG